MASIIVVRRAKSIDEKADGTSRFAPECRTVEFRRTCCSFGFRVKQLISRPALCVDDVSIRVYQYFDLHESLRSVRLRFASVPGLFRGNNFEIKKGIFIAYDEPVPRSRLWCNWRCLGRCFCSGFRRSRFRRRSARRTGCCPTATAKRARRRRGSACAALGRLVAGHDCRHLSVRR